MHSPTFFSGTRENERSFDLILIPMIVLILLSVQIGATTYTVTTTSNSGAGSLRQAITDANGSAGADTIEFNIPTSDGGYTVGPPDYWSISSLSAFPIVSDTLFIDGYTQPGAQRNTVPAPGISDAVLKIEIRGDSSPSGTTMLSISAEGCRITGLAMNRARSTCLSLIGDGTGDHIIDGNYIGTDITGTIRQGSWGGYGISILGAANNTIGGTDPGARNLISGAENVYSGVVTSGMNSSNNFIIGNYIGTDVTGSYSIPNAGGGVGLTSPNNFCGMPGAGNLISGNGGPGVRIADNNPNTVQSNLIGTDITGTSALGNSGHGMYLDRVNTDPNNNLIGGINEEDGNVIAYNTGDGVFIEQGNGNGILSNIIHSNSGLGIDLGTNGVTSNDDGDPDTGANGLQNFPVLTSVVTNGTDLTVAGTLNSTANTTFTLQYFANTAADPTGYGEGQDFIADTTITTDAAGNVSFQFTFFGAMVPVGELISATATSSSNNTSEFCQVVGVVVPIELMSFNALLEHGTVKLTWSTASEDDNLGFHIYRAEGDATIFAKLTGTLIPGAGSSRIPHTYHFIDDTIKTGMTYRYQLSDVDIQGVETYHDPVYVSVMPTTPILEQIKPNPFADNTTIQLALPVTGNVNLAIYDAAGNHVRTLINGRIDAGVQRITWDGKTDDGIRVGSGTYLCRLESGSHNASRRLIVLK